MKASVKGRYEVSKNSASTTVAINAGNVKLKASMTDATFIDGPSLNGLALGIEKPGAFIIDYNVPKKNARFQFMNSIKILEKPLNWTYIHGTEDKTTILNGTLVFDSANKLSANHVVGTRNCKLKYTYLHGGVLTFEPSYDIAKNSWDFAVSQKIYGDDAVRASYQTSSKLLGLEWTRDSKINGSFTTHHPYDLLPGGCRHGGRDQERVHRGDNRITATIEDAIKVTKQISASLNLEAENKIPKLAAESTWNFEM